MSIPLAPNLELERSSQEEWMAESVEVYARTSTANNTGGVSFTWPAKSASYKGRLAPIGNPSEYLVLSKISNRSAWMVTLPHNADVKVTDRLKVAGHTLEILGIITSGAWTTALQCICAEVQG